MSSGTFRRLVAVITTAWCCTDLDLHHVAKRRHGMGRGGTGAVSRRPSLEDPKTAGDRLDTGWAPDQLSAAERGWCATTGVCGVWGRGHQSPVSDAFSYKREILRPFKLSRGLLLPLAGSRQGRGIHNHNAEDISVKPDTGHGLCLRFRFVRDIEMKQCGLGGWESLRSSPDGGNGANAWLAYIWWEFALLPTPFQKSWKGFQQIPVLKLIQTLTPTPILE